MLTTTKIINCSLYTHSPQYPNISNYLTNIQLLYISLGTITKTLMVLKIGS